MVQIVTRSRRPGEDKQDVNKLMITTDEALTILESSLVSGYIILKASETEIILEQLTGSNDNVGVFHEIYIGSERNMRRLTRMVRATGAFKDLSLV